MHPNTAAILRYFEYDHLPTKLQMFSKPFYDLARSLAQSPELDDIEVSFCLRRLLEAKDCAVRAAL
jgi:hypothetical protein